MNVTKNSFPFGLILAILLPVLTFVVYYLFKAQEGVTLLEFYNMYFSYNVHTHIISLCVLPNLILFYAFLRHNAYNSAKGVILATMLYALAVIIMKYF